MNKCKICSKEFNTTRSWSTLCSEECRRKAGIEAVTRRRQKTTEQVKYYLGNMCVVCGYNNCPQALDAHHVFPENKKFSLFGTGNTWSIKKLLIEANKCVLLCANCHREHHAGLISTTILSEILQEHQEIRKRRAETIIGKP